MMKREWNECRGEWWREGINWENDEQNGGEKENDRDRMMKREWWRKLLNYSRE